MPVERVSNSNVESVIRQIKEVCKHEEPLTFTVVTPPSYISCFLDWKTERHQQIILVHKPYFDVDDTFLDISVLPSQCEQSSLAEVTGNPLEHPFDDVSILQDRTVDASSPKVTVLPPGVPSNDATTICSVYSMKAPASCLPIWVVCNGDETKYDGKVWLKFCRKNTGRLQVGYVIENGALETEPDPKKLLARHNKRLTKQNCPTESKIECQYKLIKDCSCEFFLNMVWPQPVFQPPTSSSSLSLNLAIEYRIGSTEGSLRFIWEQLLLINNYMKCLSSEPTRSDFPTSEAVLRQLEKSDDPPINRLGDILREPIRRAKVPTDERRDVINFVTEVTSPSYEELDALGKLWYLFLESGSLQELTNCMEKLRTELGDDHLGSHLNQIAYSTSIRKDIENMSPLKLLIEFGIVKLHKEFISIFNGAQMSVDVPNLTRFGTLRSTEWLQAVKSSMRWLAQTFVLLELLVRIQSALPDVGNSNLHSIAAEHLALYADQRDTVDVDWLINHPIQTFSSKLLPQLARRTVQENLPEEWLMTSITTEHSNYKTETRFFNGPSRRFIPAEQHNPEVTMNMSAVSCSNLTVANLADENVKFWSAEFCLIHH